MNPSVDARLDHATGLFELTPKGTGRGSWTPPMRSLPNRAWTPQWLRSPGGRRGIATLHRRFPAREDLIAATFADKMTADADAVNEALENPDPWHGFCIYVERICAMQAAEQASRMCSP